MRRDLGRSKFFRRTGCTRLCFVLGGLGASLTIGATSLTYIFLHEQLEFSASLLAKGRLSDACLAMQSLAFNLLQSSLDPVDSERVNPVWKLGAGSYKKDEIIWTSFSGEVDLKSKATLSAQKKILHAGLITDPQVDPVDPTETIHLVSHSVPVKTCTEKGVRMHGDGSELTIDLHAIKGENDGIVLANLPHKEIDLDYEILGQFAIINIKELIDSFLAAERKSLASELFFGGKPALQVEALLSVYPSNNVVLKGAEHFHYSANPLRPNTKEIAREEEGLHQSILLNSSDIEVIYEAWVDYGLLDRMPKRVAGLIFIVGIMASGVGVMMSRSALVKEAEVSDELRRQSRTDSLTELANRRAWDELLDRENNILLRHRRPFAIAVIDLDHFKQTNDSLGHSAGDALLRRTAQILQSIIRGEDVAARVGGDEFTILFRETVDQSEEQLLKRLEAAFLEEKLDVSIGIAFNKQDQTLLDVWNEADELMYQTKSQKKSKGPTSL